MKLFRISKDGGPKSTVTGFFVVEIKSLFSIALLKFNKGSRENYHSHAFNAVTFWLPGSDVLEHHKDGHPIQWKFGFKYTPRSCFHKIFANKTSYAISVRGPWLNTWKEYNRLSNKLTTLTHGRKIVQEGTNTEIS